MISVRKLGSLYGKGVVFSLLCIGITTSPTFANPLFSHKKSDKTVDDEKQANSPIRIVADEMDCDQKTNICRATGNAFAEKVGSPKKQTISADLLVAHFEKAEDKDKDKDKDKKSKDKKVEKKKSKSAAATTGDQSADKPEGSPLGSTSLKKIEAFANVIMTDDETIIRCDEGVYFTDTELADLTGNVAITQDKNVLTGTHGHANLKDGTYNIKNDSGRVEGLFYQKEKEGADKK